MSLQQEIITIIGPKSNVSDDNVKDDDNQRISTTDTFSKISEWDMTNSKFNMGGPSKQEVKLKIIPPPACWYHFTDVQQEQQQQQQQQQQQEEEEEGSSWIENHNDVKEETWTDTKMKGNCTDKKVEEKGTDTVSLVVSNGSPSKLCNYEKGNDLTTTPSNSPSLSLSPIQLTLPTLSKVFGDKMNSFATVTTSVLSPLAQELISSTALKAYHYTKLSYSNSKIFGKHYLNYSEVGNKVGGYNRKAIREEGIKDSETGRLLWKEGMVLDSSSHHLDLSLGREVGGDGEVDNTVDSQQDETKWVLPAFSSLSWVDRQLVKEWRTCNYLNFHHDDNGHVEKGGCNNKTEVQIPIVVVAVDDDWHQEDFEQARTLVPQPIQRPPWENASSCYACRRAFGAMLRHHCRLCGRSYCQTHSRWSHKLPHLGYSPDVPERVCATCKHMLESQDLAERIAWRMARCRDYLGGNGCDLCPYFEIGIDTVEDAAARLTKAAIHMAKSIPLGAQATMTVETLDILRKHGLKGVYGLILRKEFLAAADLLCKVTGINKKVWPLSVHELSAAIFYALAQHRALRGIDPEREHRIHAIKMSAERAHVENQEMQRNFNDHKTDRIDRIPFDSEIREDDSCNILVDDTDDYDPYLETKPLEQSILSDEEQTELKNMKERSDPKSQTDEQRQTIFDPVCDYVSDELLSSLILYAPLALNFIYATNEVDMQLLAAQQGWRLLYAHLNQDDGTWGGQVADKPASALFVHSDRKVACFAIRGTATIHDVVTDIRAVPVQFPDNDMDGVHKVGSFNDIKDDGWTPVSKGQGLALCGMAGAACNLFRENIDAILLLAREGYRIRLTGHSLGGSVAALLGTLIKRHFEFHLPSTRNEKDDTLRVYSYGSPACVDAPLSDYAQSYVINCVLHDDVIPRLTPTSIRALLKHLLYIRETWVKAHLTDDLMAITERAKTAWAPKLRNGFSLIHTGNPSIKVYRKLQAKGKSLRKKIRKGSKKIRSMASQSKSFKSISDDLDSCHANMHTEKADDVNSIEEDQHHSALFFEGECFYEAEESLIEQSDEESIAEASQNCTNTNITSCDMSLDSWTKFDDVPYEEAADSLIKDDADNKDIHCPAHDTPKEENIPPVLLEEAPLPRMFIPGKIVHIYTHRGAYKAAIVPKAFRELRRISMAGSMLNDHMSKSYYEALLECRSVRAAKSALPSWTGFSEEMTCCCCASRFTWASTSDSEAQEARDRHNCRACGGLVCAPCSTNRLSLPDYGIHLPSRVCDRCYYATGSSFARVGSDLSRSIVDGGCDDDEVTRNDGNDKKMTVDSECVVNGKGLSKRSHLVDELAKRMPSAAV